MVSDGGGGVEGPGNAGVAPTARERVLFSLDGMRRSEKAKVLEKA